MAGPSYFEQLKAYLASAQSQAGGTLSLTNPDDATQTVEISVQSMPERPDGWPAGLPEPLILESESAAGLAFISADNGEKYLFFRDRETGQPQAMSYEDAVHLTESLMQPVLDDARAGGNQILIDQLRAYAGQLNDAIDRDSTTGVNFGVNIPVAQITEGGVIEIREYDERPAPVVEADPVAVTRAGRGVGNDRGEIRQGVVIEGPEEDRVEDGQDSPPPPTPGYVLANELDRLAATPLTAIQDDSLYVEGKGLRVLENINRSLGSPPDPENVADYFDGRDPYKQIEESWRPIAAQYIKDSIEAGNALPLGPDSPYRQAVETLEQGRVEEAQILLEGGDVTPQIETPRNGGVEIEQDTATYNPGRVDPGTDSTGPERLARIEPAAGDEIAPEEAELRAKVENTTAQVEGLLAVAGDNDGSDVYELSMALQVQAAVSTVRSNFADAVAEDGTIDVSKLPVNGDFSDDFTADDQLRQHAERLNGLNEQYGAIDVQKRAAEMDAVGPR